MADTDKPEAKPAVADKGAENTEKAGAEKTGDSAERAEKEKLERRTATDFETGASSYEEPYLSGGVRADASLRERDEIARKIRVETGLELPPDDGGNKDSEKGSAAKDTGKD
jgi:hypothetical protein